MIRWIFPLFFSFFSLNGAAPPYSYKIVEHPYRFSTYFELQGANGFEGRAIKNSLSFKTYYDLYDREGMYEARGAIQKLSLGTFFVWGTDIDVYDKEGTQIGLIDGEALTTATAKYTFYDRKKSVVATAYLDNSCTGFVVIGGQGGKTIAHLERNFIQYVTDHWNISIYEPNAIDLRMLKIFSAFAIDFQEYFKEDR